MAPSSKKSSWDNHHYLLLRGWMPIDFRACYRRSVPGEKWIRPSAAEVLGEVLITLGNAAEHRLEASPSLSWQQLKCLG